GEGLLRKTFVSLTKWKWGRGEGKRSDNFTRLRMNRNLIVVVLAVGLLTRVSAVLAAGIDSGGGAFFENRIRPVFVEHCFKCHSAQTEKDKGGLRLDTWEGLLKG